MNPPQHTQTQCTAYTLTHAHRVSNGNTEKCSRMQMQMWKLSGHVGSLFHWTDTKLINNIISLEPTTDNLRDFSLEAGFKLSENINISVFFFGRRLGPLEETNKLETALVWFVLRGGGSFWENSQNLTFFLRIQNFFPSGPNLFPYVSLYNNKTSNLNNKNESTVKE